jgi:hypothetical protein
MPRRISAAFCSGFRNLKWRARGSFGVTRKVYAGKFESQAAKTINPAEAGLKELSRTIAMRVLQGPPPYQREIVGRRLLAKK